MSRGNSCIAKILQAARTGQGLSQRELGQRSGLTQAQISRIENGEVDLRLSSLIALVTVLGLELNLNPQPPRPTPERREAPPRVPGPPPERKPVYQVSEELPRPGLFGDMSDELL